MRWESILAAWDHLEALVLQPDPEACMGRTNGCGSAACTERFTWKNTVVQPDVLWERKTIAEDIR